MPIYRDPKGKLIVLPDILSMREEFEQFALAHDEFQIKAALDDGRMFRYEAEKEARIWLMRNEHTKADEAAVAARRAQERAAAAAERSARWTAVAAIAAAIGAIAAAAAVIVPLLTAKP